MSEIDSIKVEMAATESALREGLAQVQLTRMRLTKLETPAETIESVYGTASPPLPEGKLFELGDDEERLFQVPFDGEEYLPAPVDIAPCVAFRVIPGTPTGKRLILRDALTFTLRETGEVRCAAGLEWYIGHAGTPQQWAAGDGFTADKYPILELVPE
jgi:hypothetical protein